MADVLSRLKGKFLLSLNDKPQVRQIFARFRMIEAETTYALAASGPSAAAELIITNT